VAAGGASIKLQFCGVDVVVCVTVLAVEVLVLVVLVVTVVVVANVVVTAEPVAGDAVVKAFVVEQGQGTIPVG